MPRSAASSEMVQNVYPCACSRSTACSAHRRQNTVPRSFIPVARVDRPENHRKRRILRCPQQRIAVQTAGRTEQPRTDAADILHRFHAVCQILHGGLIVHFLHIIMPAAVQADLVSGPGDVTERIAKLRHAVAADKKCRVDLPFGKSREKLLGQLAGRPVVKCQRQIPLRLVRRAQRLRQNCKRSQKTENFFHGACSFQKSCVSMRKSCTDI